MTTFRRWATWLSIALGAGLQADRAQAQDIVFADGRWLAAIGNVGAELGPAPRVRQQDIFGGGRYGVLGISPTSQVLVGDRRTGAIVAVTGEVIAVDQARPRVFVRRAGGVHWVSVSTGAEGSVWQGDGTRVQQCAFATSSAVLYCGVRRDDALTDVVRIDVATATTSTVAAVQLPSESGTPVWLVTSDGHRLFFGGPNTGPFTPARLAVLNTVSGAVTLTTVPVEQGSIGPGAVLDELNRRLFAFQLFGGAQVAVLNYDLTLLAVAPVYSCTNVVVSPHTGRLYLGRWTDYLGAGGPFYFQALDSVTYASLTPRVTVGGSKDNNCAFLAVLSAPGAPQDLTATAAGAAVTVSWTNVGGASSFVLDVGFAPGRTDLSVSLGPDARVTFSNVPSGTYYLRVRGANESGPGTASAERMLVVP
jgi:hypothetical protein